MSVQPSVENTVTSQVGPWAMVPVWVLGAGLTSGELAVYVSLRSFADMHGQAWPRVKTIAERAGVSMRTAERAIARMRELDLLITSRLYDQSGAIRGCHYHLRDLPLSERSVYMSESPGGRDGTPPGGRDGTPPDGRDGAGTHQSEHTRVNTSGLMSSRHLTPYLATPPDDDHDNEKVLLAIRDALRTATNQIHNREWCRRVYHMIFTGQHVGDPLAYIRQCIRSNPERFSPTPIPPPVDRRALADARQHRVPSEAKTELIAATRQKLKTAARSSTTPA